MPHHHTQHVRNLGPSLFAHNENIAHVMPCGTAHAVMSCTAHACRQAGHTMYTWHARMDVPFAQAE